MDTQEKHSLLQFCRVFWGETDIFVRSKRHPFSFCSDLIGAEGLGNPQKMQCQHLLL